MVSPAPSFWTIKVLTICGWLCIVGGFYAGYVENDTAQALCNVFLGVAGSSLWFGGALLLKMVNQIRWQLMTPEERKDELKSSKGEENLERFNTQSDYSTKN